VEVALVVVVVAAARMPVVPDWAYVINDDRGRGTYTYVLPRPTASPPIRPAPKGDMHTLPPRARVHLEPIPADCIAHVNFDDGPITATQAALVRQHSLFTDGCVFTWRYACADG
jgi:hypothetical protein